MGKQVKWHINLPEYVAKDLRSRNVNISEVLRTTLQLTRLEPKYLYEVSCVKEDSIFYCTVDGLDESKVLKEMNRYDYFLMGFKVNGNGAYRIRLLGCFVNMEDSILYTELLINRALDKGMNVINKYGFTRYISFKADIPHIGKVIQTNEDLSSLIECIVNIVNKASGFSTPEKISNSINSIKSKIRKRVRPN